MEKIKSLLKLLRFELPFAAGVCVILGQLFALGEFPNLVTLISGFFAVFSISASILVLNDFFDVESDKINAPERPIPSGLVKPSEALYFAILLIFIGLLLSYTVSLSVFMISVLLFVIGFLYNRYFKKSGFWGNLLVSFSVGMTFIFGGASVGLPFNKIVIFFAIIAALIDLGEEIAADSMDVKGDLLIDSQSIAIRHGVSTARKISFYIFSVVIILSVIPFILGWFTIIYFIPIVIMDTAIGYSSFKFLKSEEEKEGRKYIRQIYLGATLGLVIFLVMRLIGL